ncbi:hypothetical protein HYC85_001383 [Camellia sinensis]|uniref:Homeobox-leucine zipper protein n=1 Tax=Camellia sinensis TaxID=4442 RepID=A0A7J7I717_CAMSI|nr:hypothetical protein HYC85_001383 [Camellia sinensis]
MEGEEYYCAPQPLEATKIESLPFPKPLQNLRKKKNKNKRRFSDEQIRSLESMFESETKLEPRKKVQLARELGLQPRQIAIWFQNRRARWKSKQMEQEYKVLKANYDNLHSKFESLKIEKQSLLIQLQNLTDLLGKPHNQDTRREPELHNMGGQVDGSLALPEKWSNFESSGHVAVQTGGTFGVKKMHFTLKNCGRMTLTWSRCL